MTTMITCEIDDESFCTLNCTLRHEYQRAGTFYQSSRRAKIDATFSIYATPAPIKTPHRGCLVGFFATRRAASGMLLI